MPLSKADVDQAITVMCAMRERGELSAPGLVEGIRAVVDDYATARQPAAADVPREDMPQAFLRDVAAKIMLDGRKV